MFSVLFLYNVKIHWLLSDIAFRFNYIIRMQKKKKIHVKDNTEKKSYHQIYMMFDYLARFWELRWEFFSTCLYILIKALPISCFFLNINTQIISEMRWLTIRRYLRRVGFMLFLFSSCINTKWHKQLTRIWKYFCSFLSDILI